MAETIERLLSLGWPGRDDYVRTESRHQAETLAKTLREGGHPEEAESLLAKVTDSESRDLFIRLTWDGAADFDLAVEEPLGATASYTTPRTVFGGSVIRAIAPMHGKTSVIEHVGRGVFTGLSSPIVASRYHSLIVAEAGLPSELEITARDGRLELEPPPVPMHLERRGAVLVAVPDTPVARLTATQVRDALERSRR